MTFLVKVQQWDLQTCRSIERIRDQNRLIILFQTITWSGSGFVYVAIAGIVALCDEEAFPGFLEASLTAFFLGLLGHLLIKKGIKRPRPYDAHPGVRPSYIPLDKFSFPSGHTTHAFLMATILTGFYPALTPALFLWASLVGLSRVILGVHYPTDVLAGLVLGLGCGMTGLIITGIL